MINECQNPKNLYPKLRTIRLFLFVSTFLFLLSYGAYPQILDIPAIGYGARSIALGRAQVAQGNVGAIFANPAGLARIKNFSLTSLYTNLSEDTPYSMLGGAFPVNEGYYGCFAVGQLVLATDDIFVTTSEVGTSPLSASNYSGRVLVLSYGNKVTNYLDFGVAAKFCAENFSSLEGASSYGTTFDLGFMVYPEERLKIGLLVQNFLFKQITWSTKTHEEAGVNIKMGIDFMVRDDITCLFDYESSRCIHAGVEWRPTKLVSVRAGVEGIPVSINEMAVNSSFGLGLNFNGFDFDYAYTVDALAKTNSSHYFSLSYTLLPLYIEKAPEFFAKSL
ncbi:hypothetical protein A3J90_05020 [candidate division WOR-1 bacterium RIFOXYC2_FULL_37_10]|uniref:DUF5723 domain-containing protein n=1 Tax=candidate division WOR-1 bacterium RIFOXYB2_FULL_37_13 TaxID=1802579 RepID=A0A1F4SRH7_UNCSA|nr:MAG: hypothetical protein A2246_02475 [candidate division WOR-1 bacterium RIFOXYA2_FULL_37_7]OGC23048.1 MAG: hypothetical protein A2310_00760 [candidate division WOR-1 bacterium RIFOXYB2_FULL_37_13]OGC34408.1 MAG: hypothetical protein A3J90_05020 [candidate division WOR-1 bacterium RIFOXYC2_FULL_37_10]